MPTGTVFWAPLSSSAEGGRSAREESAVRCDFMAFAPGVSMENDGGFMLSCMDGVIGTGFPPYLWRRAR